MAEPSLIEVFGAGATQTSTILTIVKAALQTEGITPSDNNRAESLLAAILALARRYLTPENQLTNPNQSIVIGDSTSEILFTRNNIKLRRFTLPVSFERPDTGVHIHPMDY